MVEYSDPEMMNKPRCFSNIRPHVDECEKKESENNNEESEKDQKVGENVKQSENEKESEEEYSQLLWVGNA